MNYARDYAAWMNQPPPQVNYAGKGQMGPSSPYVVPKIYPDQPDMPSYTPAYDPATMGISGEIDKALPGLGLDRSGLNAFKSDAMRKGPSEWANRAVQDQNYLAMDARDQGAKNSAGATATARAQLAARGGLSSGAAERLAQGGADNFLNMSQGVNDLKTKNVMQIGMNDEQNRISQLGQLPGMEIAAGNYDTGLEDMKLKGMQYDTTNEINANNNLNQWNMGMADIAGQQWGAMKTADAQKHEGK